MRIDLRFTEQEKTPCFTILGGMELITVLYL
jgi:hypothetical protein